MIAEVCMKNNPGRAWTQTYLTGIRTTLEGAVPTVRNRTSGHEQGAMVDAGPPYAS
jgi:hypothetical protein